MGDDDPASIEHAFGLLGEGKALEQNGDFWGAADRFLRGRQILSALAEAQPREQAEEAKIAELYQQQATEYLHQSRTCLIRALQDETNTNQNSDQNSYENLSDDEARRRIRTFSELFSRRVGIPEPDEAEETETTSPDEQQRSIEERLQELNASLPSGFKTDQERLDGINRGLNRLGLSLYTQKKPFQSFQDTLPKSEDEQIEDIINQATDEVAFDQKFGTKHPALASDKTKGDFDDDDEIDDTDDDDDDDDDPDLDDEQLAIKHIRQRVVKAQAKLAELVACLDEASSAIQKQNDSETEGLDSDSEADKGRFRPSSDVLAVGKKKLVGARRDLNKAVEEWKQDLV